MDIRNTGLAHENIQHKDNLKILDAKSNLEKIDLLLNEMAAEVKLLTSFLSDTLKDPDKIELSAGNEDANPILKTEFDKK